MRIGQFGRNRGRGGQLRRCMSWKVRLIPIVLFALYGLYYYVSNQETVPGIDQLSAGFRDQGDTPFQCPDFSRYADMHACFTLPPFFRTIARSHSGGARAAAGPASISGIAPVSTGTRRLFDWSDYT